MNVTNPQIPNLLIQFEDYYARGLFPNALEVAQKIYLEAEKIQSFEIKASAYVKQMHCYYSLGEIENAFDYILKFRLLCDGTNNPKINYYIHMINGYIYDYEENYSLAANELQQAINISLELNHPKMIANSQNLYAHVLLKNEEIQLAYKIAKSNYNYIKDNLSSNLLIACHSQHILATTQIENEFLDEALPILEELSKNPLIVYNKKERSRYYFAFATYFVKRKQYTEAISHFQKCESLAFQNNDTMLLKRIYKFYATIYAYQNKYKNAYIQMQNYAHLLEQTIKLNFSSKIKELDFKQTNFQLEQKVNLDALSGLYNRSYVEQTSNQWLYHAKKTNDYIYLAAFDVDNFKQINDTYGHIYGDEVIKHIGKYCKEVIPDENSICARYGGDEFVVILKNFSAEHSHELIQELFHKITNNSILIGGITIKISISMGITNNEDFPSKRFIQLFRIADQALYAAKNQGKNQIVEMLKQTNTPCFSVH